MASLFLHLNLLVPVLFLVFSRAKQEEAERAEEVDMGFESVPEEQLPHDLPPLDDTPVPPVKVADEKDRPKLRDRTHDKKKREEPPKPEKKVAEAKPPPEPEVTVPPLPPMPPPPPEPPKPPAPEKAHEKVVDLDNDKEVEPPPDAKYLAQKNNRAAVETRATRTNLEREQKGGEGSVEEGKRSEDKEIGDDHAKIADLEEQKSKLGRAAPEVTPHENPEAPPPPEPERAPLKSPVLSLRDAAPRGHEITPETVDPSLPHDPAGMMARARPHGAFRDDQTERPSAGKRLRLALSGKDYEYLFGSESKADRQLAQKVHSARLGKHAQKLARVTSALENFIPEVQPGNQTALNTRAAPFAAFIAHMHRNIHSLWGFGVLDDWDELPSSSPLNDETLVTTLEISLNRDGTVAKVTVVRPSKYLGFDAAAIDVVYTAGPYPEPPREIRSGNGKVYLRWSFHRDGRQCATTFAEPYILNNAPKGGDKSDGEGGPAGTTNPPSGAAAAGASRAAPRRLERNLGGVPGAAGSPEGGSPEGRRSSSSTAPSDGKPLFSEGEGAAPAARGPVGPAGGGPRGAEPAAAALANDWFAAYARGDVGAMTARAAFPFRSATGIAAKSHDELDRMLRSLIAETPARQASSVALETPAGLRKLIGKLPPGLDDGSDVRFAVMNGGADALILVLAQQPGGVWKVSGLIRR